MEHQDNQESTEAHAQSIEGSAESGGEDVSLIVTDQPEQVIIQITEDIPNSYGILVPNEKNVGSLLDYDMKLKEKIVESDNEQLERKVLSNNRKIEAMRSQNKIAKALSNSSNSTAVNCSILSLLKELKQDMNIMHTDMKKDLDNVKKKIQSIEKDVGSIKKDVGSIKKDVTPIIISSRLSQNKSLRELNRPPKSVPFISGDYPAEHGLPVINTVQDINALNVAQLRDYLKGYDVKVRPNTPRAQMKTTLRRILQFTLDEELDFMFT